MFLSDAEDKLPVHCVAGECHSVLGRALSHLVILDKAGVVYFDENNPLQDPLTLDDVFYRSEMRKRTIEEAANVASPGLRLSRALIITQMRALGIPQTAPKKKRPSHNSVHDFEKPVIVVRVLKSTTSTDLMSSQPLSLPTCFCHKPYVPLPLDQSPMIYCAQTGQHPFVTTV